MKRKRLSVFLSYAFRPKQQAYSQSEILSLVERACGTASADLARDLPGLSFSVTAELTEYGGHLNEEILSRLASADICIVDISDNNPNVFYELGALHILGRRPILLKSKKEEYDFPVPSDIQGTTLLKYDEISDIQGRLAVALVSSTRALVRSGQERPLELCREFWGDRNEAQSSHVLVAPRSSIRTVFSEVNSPNFIYLDRLGDKDAVVELSVLLARLYPKMPIVRYVSDELPRDAYEADLVVIGGPGSPSAEGASNVLVSPLHTKIGIKVSYSEDCERLIVEGVGAFEAVESDGGLVRDYGFFAKSRNPYNPARSVVLVHGIHTYGVLGAARCFSDHPAALENVSTVLDRLGPDPSFWAYFEVDILGGAAMVPRIQPERIFRIE